MREAGGIKLTAKGQLPQRVCKELYPLGLPDWEFIEKENRIWNESRLRFVSLARFVASEIGMIQIQKDKLVLSAKGEKLLQSPTALWKAVIEAFCLKLDLAEEPGFESIGNVGLAYNFYLLCKYGHEPHDYSFYAEKYLALFPAAPAAFIKSFPDVQEVMQALYLKRVFMLAMLPLGFVQMQNTGSPEEASIDVEASELFYEIFGGGNPLKLEF